MGSDYKDYYEILGVARSASADDIRKAFRALAREYHPDVAKNKAGSEGKFKEINEAYEVLGDAEKRKKYDALGADWKQGANFRRPSGSGWANAGSGTGGGRSRNGGDFEFRFGGGGFSDFFEQLFGASGGQGDFRKGKRSPFAQGGAHNPGKGRDIESDLLVSLHEVLQGALRPITLQKEVRCDVCHGKGKVRTVSCSKCRGAGQTSKTEHYQVKIPAGVREGQRLRIPGQGEPGGGSSPAGDLYLRIHYEQHPEFRVEGDHLAHDLALAPWEAVLGAQVAAPTLEGRVNIRVPAGSQHGTKLRLSGRGLPRAEGGRGDLVILLRVQIPERLSARERALWESLGRESDFHPREGK